MSRASSPTSPDTTGRPRAVGILGAGRAGTALARALASAGIPVRIASTRSPTAMRLHLVQYAPRATAVPAEDIATGVDLVVLMVPQEDLDTVDPDWLADTVLVDATNRWEGEPVPGWLQSGLDAGSSSSEVVAARFPRASVVKTLNHLSHWDMDTAVRHASPAAPGETTGETDRRALGVAADSAPAAAAVGHLVRAVGFEPVVLPDLAAGRVLEPGGPVFNRPVTAAELARLAGTVGGD